MRTRAVTDALHARLSCIALDAVYLANLVLSDLMD